MYEELFDANGMLPLDVEYTEIVLEAIWVILLLEYCIEDDDTTWWAGSDEDTTIFEVTSEWREECLTIEALEDTITILDDWLAMNDFEETKVDSVE